MKILQTLVASVLLSSSLSSLSFAAANETKLGIEAFNRKDYRQCVVLLDRALAQNPKDAQAWYYRALAYVKSGDIKEAQLAYQDVLLRCPNTQECQLAKQGLAQLAAFHSPSTRAVTNSSTSAVAPAVTTYSGSLSSILNSQPISEASGSSGDRLPAEASIAYTTDKWNRTTVSGSINNVSVPMELDTGSDKVIIPQNLAEANGIQLGNLGRAVGEYNRTGSKVWIVKAEMSVGDIKRRDFPVYVFEPGPWPSAILLGNNFFTGYTVEKDQKYGQLVCRKSDSDQTVDPALKSEIKDVRTSFRGGYLIPFKTSRGGQPIISCKVNGTLVDMMFDSGATPGINFTWQQAEKSGIQLDGASGSRGGIGATRIPYSKAFFDVEIGTFHAAGVGGKITDAEQITWGSDYPLIGPDVFESQGYSWKLDRTHNVIDLEKKN